MTGRRVQQRLEQSGDDPLWLNLDKSEPELTHAPGRLHPAALLRESVASHSARHFS